MASPTKHAPKKPIAKGPAHTKGVFQPYFTSATCTKDVLPDAQERVGLMLHNGFPNDTKTMAEGAAIMECENSDKTKGCNSVPACGIWQINLSAHKDITSAQAQNACTATRYAYKLWKAAGNSFDKDWAASAACWKPRSVPGGDLYEAVAHGTSTNPAGPGLSGVVGAVTNPIADITGFIARLFEPALWLRVGKGLLGFALILYGAQALSKALLGLDLAGPAQAFAKVLASNNPAAETASTGARVSSRVTKYRTKGSKVIANKTKVKPTEGGGFGDEPPF